MSAAEAPLYRQLERELVRAIARGRYAVGDFLPTEAELCEKHELSRQTVRSALRRLDDLGMIERKAGVGTRVVSAHPLEDRPYAPVATSAEDIVDLVTGTRIVDIRSRSVRVDAALARRIGCRAGTRWFLMEGPRVPRSTARGRSDPRPLCWSEQYLRSRSASARERLLRGDFESGDLAGQRIEQEISAGLLGADRAVALDSEPGGAALIVTRRHFDRKGVLLSTGIHTHPADRYRIAMTLRPGAPT